MAHVQGRIGLFTAYRKEAECAGCSNFKRDLAWKTDVETANGSERVKSSILSE
jgi:hypothetical protein